MTDFVLKMRDFGAVTAENYPRCLGYYWNCKNTM